MTSTRSDEEDEAHWQLTRDEARTSETREPMRDEEPLFSDEMAASASDRWRSTPPT